MAEGCTDYLAAITILVHLNLFWRFVVLPSLLLAIQDWLELKDFVVMSRCDCRPAQEEIFEG